MLVERKGELQYRPFIARAAAAGARRPVALPARSADSPSCCTRRCASGSVKAMVLAAGLGTRMRAARDCAKPALPVLDVAVIARLVRALAAAGVERAIINTQRIREPARRAPRLTAADRLAARAGAARQWRGILGARTCSATTRSWSSTAHVPGARLRGALRPASESRALVTLALRDDSRKRDFGSIGYDRDAHVCRITDRIQLGSEKASGLFIGCR